MNYVRRTLLQLSVVGMCAVVALMVMIGLHSQGASADTAVPVISNIASSVTDNGAVITWNTDQNSTSQVAYGTTTDYGSFSTLDANNVTSHSVSLSGLASSTLYHYQIISSNGTNSTATSSDQTFTTSSTTDTGAPVISAVFVTPTMTDATVTWTTDEPATSQVQYGLTSSYDSATTIDSSLVTSHSVLVLGLTPGTLYHFSVNSSDVSDNNASSTDYWFTTVASTSTGTTTDLSDLENRVTSLEGRVGVLEGLVQNLLNWWGNHGTTTPPSDGGNAIIDQDGQQVRAGTNTDFGGHNFGSEEHVKVTLNGSQVATAFTNLAGGFSTGSVTVPNTPGSYTYTFTGLNSGIIRTATITVIP